MSDKFTKSLNDNACFTSCTLNNARVSYFPGHCQCGYLIPHSHYRRYHPRLPTFGAKSLSLDHRMICLRPFQSVGQSLCIPPAKFPSVSNIHRTMSLLPPYTLQSLSVPVSDKLCTPFLRQGEIRYDSVSY